MIAITEKPDNLATDENLWWFLYDPISNEVVLEPLQCSGFTSSPMTMVVADSKEELEDYISNLSLNKQI